MTEHALLPPQLYECLPKRLLERLRSLAASGKIRADELEEIRLRAGQPVSLTVAGRNLRIGETLTHDALCDTVTALCRGSVYAHDDTIRDGYIRMDGGIRVGVCGTMAVGHGVREITSLNIRIPHAIRGVCDPILPMCMSGGSIRSVLIYSPPGAGKTTLLRDLAAKLAGECSRRVALLDTRGELYIAEMFADTLCDVLTGYPRASGMEIATRTLSPEVIICDELGDLEEARQILSTQNTGVPVIASAHAADVRELLARPNIRLLHENGVFSGYVGIMRERISGRLARQFTCRFTQRCEETELCRA